MAQKKLTPRELKFVDAFMRCGVAITAYIEAYRPPAGTSKGTNQQRAVKELAKPHVAAAIEELRNETVERVIAREADVLRRWMDIAFADPNDLVQHRRVNCRHCWGVDGAYQWVDEEEWAFALARQAPTELPHTDAGGYGFDAYRKPRKGCKKCHGEGTGLVHVNDTRELSGRAKALYAGVKQTKDGIQVLMHDQAAALANIAKFLGMLDREPQKGNNEPVQETLAKLIAKLPG